MAEHKRGLGYDTPARSIQDQFMDIQAELAKAETDWAGLNKVFLILLTELNQKLESGAWDASSAADFAAFGIIALGGMTSKLGVELTETRKQLAKVEKIISELKLAK